MRARAESQIRGQEPELGACIESRIFLDLGFRSRLSSAGPNCACLASPHEHICASMLVFQAFFSGDALLSFPFESLRDQEREVV